MENGQASPRRWFTAKEAANYLQIHVRTLYGYVRKGRGRKPPFRRFGKGNYRFPVEKFKEWADGPQK